MEVFFNSLRGNFDVIKLKIHSPKGQNHSQVARDKKNEKINIFKNLMKMQFAMKNQRKIQENDKKHIIFK